MKEILFRGKTPSNQWVCGGIFPGQEGYSVIYTLDDAEPRTVRSNTVGQFTGLFDKNGTKIFEGDIIKIGHTNRLMDVRWNGETCAWELTDVGVEDWEVNHPYNTLDLAEIIVVETAYGDLTSEIIGNIHDNPEFSHNCEEYIPNTKSGGNFN